MTVSNGKSAKQVLQQTIQFIELGNFPEAIPPHDNWVNVMGKVYAFDFTEALAALEEIMVAANPEEMTGLPEDSAGSVYAVGIMTGWNRCRNQYEQNIRQAFSNGGGDE